MAGLIVSSCFEGLGDTIVWIVSANPAAENIIDLVRFSSMDGHMAPRPGWLNGSTGKDVLSRSSSISGSRTMDHFGGASNMGGLDRSSSIGGLERSGGIGGLYNFSGMNGFGGARSMCGLGGSSIKGGFSRSCSIGGFRSSSIRGFGRSWWDWCS